MTKEQQTKYMETEPLRQIIVKLEDQKFKLDCGHHITFGHFLGNDLTIRNGKKPTLICSQCGY
jgi:hypothetical protein